MTCSHNVVFLLDMASSMQKVHLHLGTLKILNYLGCRFGLTKVRWGFKFFDSFGVQSKISWVCSFHELGSRSWEDFEEELETKFENRYHALNVPGPSPRATLTQNVLKEALLDYQWDRPEIVSPAKVVLRSQKNKLTVASENSNPSAGFMNTIFLFSPCPHSQRELQQFVSGSQAHLPDQLPTLQDLSEKFIPKGIQEMMAAQKITLHWVDTADDSTVMRELNIWDAESQILLGSPDDVGYHTMAELMHVLKGTILPSEIFVPRLNCRRTETFPSEPISPEPLSSWATILPLDSTLNYLFSSPSALQASFPRREGLLFFKSDGTQKPQSCAVTLERLTVSQRHFENPVSISLKCTLADWNMMHTSSFRTENWIIRNSALGQSAQEKSLFQHLVRCTLAQGLHLVAEVSPSGSCSPCTGIFTPISSMAAVLTLLWAERMAEAERCLLPTAEERNLSTQDDFSLPEMVSSVLSQVNDLKEIHPASPETPLPEWAQQELSRTHRWSPVVIEGWYLSSNLCGASSPLMESLRLLQAAPAALEETQKPEMELTQSLSRYYQQRVSETSATSNRRDNKKRRGAPQTPVRQKMKTMPRSLQMLNVARLNVRAQKLQPDEELAISEKGAQRLLPRKSDDRAEEKGRTARAKLDFKTEEEMVSYATTSYQKVVADGENLSSWARDIVEAMNVFQKKNEARERATSCTDAVRSSLLKSSKALRQQLGNIPDKQVKVRECQLQVYLRLEMSLQCPLKQNSADETEQLVEEMTEVLRILCLTEDPAYLTRFLEEVVEMYMESIPKTLGSLYYSLGTQAPPKLASLLPADFFGDDSMSQESQAPSLPPSTASDQAARSASISDEAERLQELRTRSAKKRKSTLSRHRSVTEASLNLRQIEIPQVPKARTRKGSSRASLGMNTFPAAQETQVQEVTKVRRNLFNEKMRSPGKRIPRSQSASALEGLKSQSNEAPKDHHKLLTKRVAETPLHKQISRRLLYRQIQGRCSDPGSEVGIVEESPEKALTCGLRRSPRIKQLLLARTFSGSFPSSQAVTKNAQGVPSARLEGPGNPEDLTGWALPSPKKTIHSPKSLLFGALHEPPSSEGMQSQRKSLASDDPVAYQTPKKTPRQSFQRFLSPPSHIPRRSPRIQKKIQQTLLKSPVPKQTVAKNLGSLFSPPKQKTKPSPTPTKRRGKSLALSTPSKENLPPPCRAGQLYTPGKQETGEVFDEVFDSPPQSSHSASSFAAATLSPLDPKGSSPSPPHYPRRSLRTAQKPTPSASAQRQTPEAERSRDLKSLTQSLSDSVPSDRTPRKFKSGPLDQSLSPKSPGDAEVLLPRVSLFNFASLSCMELGMAYAFSPRRTSERVGETCTPKKSPLKPQSASDITPAESVQSPSCMSEKLSCVHGSKGESPRWDVITTLSPETDLFCKPGIDESASLMQASGTVAPSKRDSERELSPELLARDSVCILDAIEASESVELSASTNMGTPKLLSNSSPEQQGPMALQDKVLPAAVQISDLEHPFFHPPQWTMESSAPRLGSRAYTLRCTPDRRQREAAARLGKLETMSNLNAPSTPALPSATSPPTYEVQLEMQASGLPKLRIKRVGSGASIKLPSQAETQKTEGDASELDAGDLCVSWCGRHSGKPEAACISPSCFRSTHTTPGKLGRGQTYICQSYTPSRCISSSTPPSDGNTSVSRTPSPKQKVRVTPEAIKDWPRRKRAVAGCNRSERQAEPAAEIATADESRVKTAEPFDGSKALGMGEFELEGVYRLQDQSPCSDTGTCRDKCVHQGAFGLQSRKRVFEYLSPEEDTSWDAKRACPLQEAPALAGRSTELTDIGQERAPSVRTSLEKEEAFKFSGLTPPSSSGKSSISASSLRALTQSPLLYKGRAASQKKHPPEDDSESGAKSEGLSPFSSAPPKRRPLSRIYSRKRLLS